MIHFVGAGPGAADLITMRGHQLLTEADVIIYAGSLVNPELLQYAKASCSIYNSASMTLEEVIDVMKQAEAKNQMTVRLHTGDPSLYGAIREQMDQLDKDNISYDLGTFCLQHLFSTWVRTGNDVQRLFCFSETDTQFCGYSTKGRNACNHLCLISLFYNALMNVPIGRINGRVAQC